MNQLSQKPANSSRNTLLHASIILSAVAIILVCLVCGGGFVWIFTFPDCSVKLENEINPHVPNFIKEQGLVEADETILVYYDLTMRCTGNELAILTDQRLVYHVEGGTNTFMPLADIVDIQHREEPLIGDIIVAINLSGQAMKIEIAPLNGGEEFYNVLLNAGTTRQIEVTQSG